MRRVVMAEMTVETAEAATSVVTNTVSLSVTGATAVTAGDAIFGVGMDGASAAKQRLVNFSFALPRSFYLKRSSPW
jgi:hypothetical protein